MATLDEIDEFTAELFVIYQYSKADKEAVMDLHNKYLADIPEGVLKRATLDIVKYSPDFFPSLAKIRKVCKDVLFVDRTVSEGDFAPPETPIERYWKAMAVFNNALGGRISVRRTHPYDDIYASLRHEETPEERKIWEDILNADSAELPVVPDDI